MKLIIKLLAIAVLGLVALLVAGYFLVPPAADKAVDEGSRYAFGVPAEIGKISASPGLSNTSVGFEDYVLKGPTGFDESLLSIGKFSLGVGTKSLIGDTKDVGEFVLSDVNLNLIQRGVESNLLPVLRHLQGLGGADEASAPDGSPRDGSAGPKLKIGSIRVENVGATISLEGIPGIDPIKKTFSVPDYTQDWSDVTGEEGRTVAEISALLIDDLKSRALSAGEGVVPAPVLDAVSKTLDGGLEGGLQGGLEAAKDALRGQAEDQLDKVQDKVEGAVEGAQDELKKAADGALKDVEKKGKELLKGTGVDDALKKVKGKGLKGLLGDG
ncbi:MAG: hypothetical protein AAGG01_03410 [Planctomycetota bacterium]